MNKAKTNRARVQKGTSKVNDCLAAQHMQCGKYVAKLCSSKAQRVTMTTHGNSGGQWQRPKLVSVAAIFTHR
jgi:hypothetical protein